MSAAEGVNPTQVDVMMEEGTQVMGETQEGLPNLTVDGYRLICFLCSCVLQCETLSFYYNTLWKILEIAIKWGLLRNKC